MLMKKVLSFPIKLLLVAVAAFVVFNYGFFREIFGKINEAMQPIFIGITLALIMNVPAEFFEKKLFAKLKREKLKKALSLALSVLILAGVAALVFGLAVPAGVESVKGIFSSKNDSSPFDKLANTSAFMNFLVTQGRVLYENFASKISDYMPQMLDIAKNVFKIAANILLGLGIAIMLLANKTALKNQASKLFGFLLKGKNTEKITEIADIAVSKFSRYLGGQVLEAVILGSVCYLCMLILRLPYAALISLVIGFSNLIPIVGAYVGGGLSALLIFSVSPAKAVVFVIFILILQQVESFTTYPVIVGKYVGLNGFWIMVSIVLWGGLLGFWGVFLGVPFTAFLHDLLGSFIAQKNNLPALPPSRSDEPKPT